jgi:hypothetical protein
VHIPGSKTHYPIHFLASQSTSLPWGQSSFNHWILRNVCLFFPGQGCRPCAQPPTWRIRVSLFVWVITLDLSGMGGPTRSISYRQHSSQVHVTAQAPPLRQSRDTIGGNMGNYIYLIDGLILVMCMFGVLVGSTLYLGVSN